jgi:hypothetical protein
MGGHYRITVRGEISERFCRGFGCVSRREDGRTVLEADLPGAPRLREMLARLDNLGLEVLEVEGPRDRTHDGRTI